MALDNSVKKLRVDGTPQTSNTSTVGSNVGMPPKLVSFKFDDEQNPLVKTLKSPEFLGLSDEDKIKKLKELIPTITDEQIAETLNYVKTTIEKVSVNAELQPQSTDDTDKSEVEKLAENHALKLGKNATIEDVIADIKTKNPEELTDDEKKILEFYDSIGDKEKTKALIEKYAGDIDKLIPDEVIKSDEWQNKTPIQKLNARTDALLSKIVPNYYNMSKEEQNKFKNDMFDTIGSKLDPNWNNLSPEAKQAKIEMIALVADVSENSDLTVKQFLAVKPDEQANLFIKYANDKVLDKIYNDSEKVKELENLSPDKKLDKIIDYAIDTLDPSLKGKEREIKKQQYINTFAKQMYPNWDSLSKIEKLEKKYSLGLSIDAIKKSGKKSDILVKAFISKDRDAIKLLAKLKLDVLNEKYPPDGKFNLTTARVRAQLKIQEKTGKSVDEITDVNDTILDYLKSIPKEQRTPEQRLLIKTITQAKKHYNLDSNNQQPHIEESIGWHIEAEGVEKYVNNMSSNDIEIIKSNPDEFFKHAHFTNPETAEAFCKQLGIEFKDEYLQYISEDNFALMTASADVTKDQEARKKMAGYNHRAGHNDIVETQIEMAICPEYKISNDAVVDFAQTVTKLDVNYTENVARSWNSEYVTSNDRKILITDFTTSPNTSDEVATQFSKSIVTTSNSKTQLLENTATLSEVHRAAVTEGLAAAESFVKENYGSDVSKQYSSYVDNAIKNNGYSSDEINNINTARETGQTSYERNSVSSDSSKTSTADSTSSTNSKTQTANNATANPASAQTSNATAKATTSAASATPVKVKVSPANFNAVMEMKAQIAQVNYEHSIALRDKALADLERVIDKIQNDQQVRAEKQAKIAEKEAKTDEEIAQAIKEAEAKSAEEQKQAQEQITKETIAEIEQQEKLEKKYHISAETIEVLRNAQKQGDLSTIYTKLGEISADAQKHFVQYLSRKDTATIIGFIRNQSSNKALIKELCRLNPGLIKSLDAQMLLDCGIEKADIIKYSDSHQLSILMYDLAKTGNTRVLNQFYDVLGDDAQQVASMPSKPVPGSDEWMMANMPIKVSMRHDIDKHVPRKFWG